MMQEYLVTGDINRIAHKAISYPPYMEDVNDPGVVVMKLNETVYKRNRRYFTWKIPGGPESWWDLDVGQCVIVFT